IPAGTYTIHETTPAGYTDGKDTLGTVNGVTKGTAGNDVFSNVAITSGQTAVNYNFGEYKTGSLSGMVYVDYNNNAQVDLGEMGIDKVTITLTGTNDLGQSINVSTQTDEDGLYEFDGLRPGTYALTESNQPAGFLDGIDTIGSQGGVAGNDKFTQI